MIHLETVPVGHTPLAVVAPYIRRAKCAQAIVMAWTFDRLIADHLIEFRDCAGLEHLRLIVDPSWLTRKPHAAAALIRTLGERNIRATPTHAKLVAATGPARTVAMVTTANMAPAKVYEVAIVLDGHPLADTIRHEMTRLWQSAPPSLRLGRPASIDRWRIARSPHG